MEKFYPIQLQVIGLSGPAARKSAHASQKRLWNKCYPVGAHFESMPTDNPTEFWYRPTSWLVKMEQVCRRSPRRRANVSMQGTGQCDAQEVVRMTHCEWEMLAVAKDDAPDAMDGQSSRCLRICSTTVRLTQATEPVYSYAQYKLLERECVK